MPVADRVRSAVLELVTDPVLEPVLLCVARGLKDKEGVAPLLRVVVEDPVGSAVADAVHDALPVFVSLGVPVRVPVRL